MGNSGGHQPPFRLTGRSLVVCEPLQSTSEGPWGPAEEEDRKHTEGGSEQIWGTASQSHAHQRAKPGRAAQSRGPITAEAQREDRDCRAPMASRLWTWPWSLTF